MKTNEVVRAAGSVSWKLCKLALSIVFIASLVYAIGMRVEPQTYTVCGKALSLMYSIFITPLLWVMYKIWNNI